MIGMSRFFGHFICDKGKHVPEVCFDKYAMFLERYMLSKCDEFEIDLKEYDVLMMYVTVIHSLLNF